MHSNLKGCLSAVVFFERLPALDLGSGLPLQEDFCHEEEGRADSQVGRLDAYEMAVLLLVGAAILSICF
jgi:hypothetical protein